MKMEEIPPQLVMSWDQAGLNLVPVTSWTMAAKGSKHVKIQGLNDKRQITGLLWHSHWRVFAHSAYLWQKDTSMHPTIQVSIRLADIIQSNHWSNKESMWSYIDNVIAPFIDCVREDLTVEKDQVALAIFDTFKGQLTPKVTQCL